MHAAAQKHKLSRSHRPTWEIVELYPKQGEWTEEEYLALDTERQIEFSDGYLEFLPVPKISHEDIALFLYHALYAFVSAAKLGLVYHSHVKIRLWPGKMRIPDILFVANNNRTKRTDDYFSTADLVMEIVSDDRESRKRDTREKRRLYANASIPEYWIVDPKEKKITVLKLHGTNYAVHGEFKLGQKATSALLKGFSVDVSDALAGLKQ